MQKKAINYCIKYLKDSKINYSHLEVIEEKDRTPCVIVVIEGNAKNTTMMYGHIDKQPPLTDSWAEDLHPYKPVIKDGKLYGRGGADDGYAFFTCISIIKVLQQNKVNHN